MTVFSNQLKHLDTNHLVTAKVPTFHSAGIHQHCQRNHPHVPIYDYTALQRLAHLVQDSPQHLCIYAHIFLRKRAKENVCDVDKICTMPSTYSFMNTSPPSRTYDFGNSKNLRTCSKSLFSTLSTWEKQRSHSSLQSLVEFTIASNRSHASSIVC